MVITTQVMVGSLDPKVQYMFKSEVKCVETQEEFSGWKHSSSGGYPVLFFKLRAAGLERESVSVCGQCRVCGFFLSLELDEKGISLGPEWRHGKITGTHNSLDALFHDKLEKMWIYPLNHEACPAEISVPCQCLYSLGKWSHVCISVAL